MANAGCLTQSRLHLVKLDTPALSLEHLTIQTPQPTLACCHPSEGGELLKSPPLEGCRNGGVGFLTDCYIEALT